MQWDDIVEEKRHVVEVLKKCGYPDWALVDVVSVEREQERSVERALRRGSARVE